MKGTDYIIDFLVKQNVKDVYGYPGGVICHFMDSVTKFSGQIQGHIHYHEQAAAFAACACSHVTGRASAVYVTSGPGATNIITGVADAFFDSIPVIFFTGQVDTYGLRPTEKMRQCGFQETDVVSLASSITKYCKRIDNAEDLPAELEKAWKIAHEGRPGPVLLDLPADVQRANISAESAPQITPETPAVNEEACRLIVNALRNSSRPCFVLGAGIKKPEFANMIRQLLHAWNIPAVFSMPAFDILPWDDALNIGFIGTNGHRSANFCVAKSDLLITMGTRLDLKQVGNIRSNFAPQAQIIRIDIDEAELDYKIHDNVINIQTDLSEILPGLIQKLDTFDGTGWSDWQKVCTEIVAKAKDYDNQDDAHQKLKALSAWVPDNVSITVDVGQHQPWTAQAFGVKENQSVWMSAGLGSMGYSLPAAIGCCYATGKPAVSINGDGGVQMNIQELQFIKRENLPVTVVVLNNRALGMIRQFQEANFEQNYYQTTQYSGYAAPDFEKIAAAYDMEYHKISTIEDFSQISFRHDGPAFLEIEIPEVTWLNPKFGRQRPLQDMEPLMDRELYHYLSEL